MDVPSDLVSKGLEKLDISLSKTGGDGVQTYKLGDWKLQSGQSLPNAHIAYKTFGDPKSPTIIYPSWYSGCESNPTRFPHFHPLTITAIADNEWLIGPDKVLNPSKYFVVITALFGNGQSTSPTNSDVVPFPDCTFYDNVRAQHALVTQHLGITHARAVLGWSMGAGQTYQVNPQFTFLVFDICHSSPRLPPTPQLGTDGGKEEKSWNRNR